MNMSNTDGVINMSDMSAIKTPDLGDNSLGIDVTSHIEGRILEILSVYPKISPTMLQAGLGPSLSPSIWRPALQALVDRGVVFQSAEFPTSGSKRTRPFTVIELARTSVEDIKVPPVPSA